VVEARLTICVSRTWRRSGSRRATTLKRARPAATGTTCADSSRLLPSTTSGSRPNCSTTSFASPPPGSP